MALFTNWSSANQSPGYLKREARDTGSDKYGLALIAVESS